MLNNIGKKFFLAKIVGLIVLYMRGEQKASSLSALQRLTFVIYADRQKCAKLKLSIVSLAIESPFLKVTGPPIGNLFLLAAFRFIIVLIGER